MKQIATGQGVPLAAVLGGKIRLFFEAQVAISDWRWDGAIGTFMVMLCGMGQSGSCNTILVAAPNCSGVHRPHSLATYTS